ncbi:hypothetical protein CsatA_027070 [Cannabis sativa]
MPVGTIIRLLSTNDIDMVGTLGKLYQSLENLNETYLQSSVNKDSLLKPKSSMEGCSPNNLFLLTNNDSTKSNNVKNQLYLCSYCTYYVSHDPSGLCPGCRKGYFTRALTQVAQPSTNNTKVGSSMSSSSSSSSFGVDGIVKEVVTYMIMDDLEVKPMSTISSVAIFNSFNVKDVSTLQEKIVTVGIDEGLSLLKASLQVKRVLTNVFIGK